MKNGIASSVGRIQADCLSQFTSKSKFHIAYDDTASDLIEQHSLEAWTQPGSSPDQPTASMCTPPHMGEAPSTEPHEVVASMAPKSFKLAVATEAKIQGSVTAESERKNGDVSPEL